MSSPIHSEAEVVLDAMRQRRTVPWARVSGEPLREEHLTALLEAANWAPSHMHTEPWRFVVFRGEGRKQIAELLASTYKLAHAHDFKDKKYQKSLERPVSVGAVIAILMRPSQDPVMPEVEELLAMGAAVQNLHLAAHSLGIGGSLSTPDYLEHEQIRNYFELAEQDRCLGIFYLGYLEGEAPSSRRGEIAAKVRFVDQ